MRLMTILLLTLMMTSVSTLAQDKTSCEALKKLVAMDMAIWNDRAPARTAEVYHQDCMEVGEYNGLQQRKEIITKALAENPKLTVTAKDIICGDNAVTVHFETSGYNSKYGVEFSTTGIYSVHIKDGKYWKMDGELDILTPLLTAGYTLTPPKN